MKPSSIAWMEAIAAGESLPDSLAKCACGYGVPRWYLRLDGNCLDCPGGPRRPPPEPDLAAPSRRSIADVLAEVERNNRLLCSIAKPKRDLIEDYNYLRGISDGKPALGVLADNWHLKPSTLRKQLQRIADEIEDVTS